MIDLAIGVTVTMLIFVVIWCLVSLIPLRAPFGMYARLGVGLALLAALAMVIVETPNAADVVIVAPPIDHSAAPPQFARP